LADQYQVLLVWFSFSVHANHTCIYHTGIRSMCFL